MLPCEALLGGFKREGEFMLTLNLLSRPRVMLDGEAVNGFVSDKALALLCYLALNEGQQSREILAALLWGEMPGDRARANLRVALHNLRNLLPAYFQVDRKQVAFARGKPHWIDVVVFEAAAARHTPQSLAKAAALFQDDFLRGLHVNGAPELEAWLRGEQERLRLCLIDVLERLGKQYSQRRQWEKGTTVMRRLLEIEPWREQTHRQLMLLLARQGKYAAALAQYEQCRELLVAELDVAPADETEKLHYRILQLRSQPHHNLPPAPTPLVGRVKELAVLSQRLNDPTCRLLTLFGPGGIGKTRLALALAERERERFLEGAYYVPLSDVASARHVPLAIAEAMGVSFEGARSFAEQLLNYLNGREVLLILDNFEQLLEGTSFIQRLLNGAPTIKVLVASRVVLNIPGEWTFEVTGLGLPDPSAQDLDTADAVQLFLQKARRRQHDFAPRPSELQAIGQICRLVEGIPLAVEQAASWLRVMNTRQLVGELDRGIFILTHAVRPEDDRHRSMWAVLEQSWHLLGAEEQKAFRGMSLFRGGFTRQAAEKITGTTIPTLAALVNHSMLRFDEASARYQMHELIRQFAAEKLADDETTEAALRDQHAAYYASFMGRRQRALEGKQERMMLNEIRNDLENVRAAWNRVLEQQNAKVVPSFVRSLWYFLEVEGWYWEGLEVYREALNCLRSVSRSQKMDPILRDVRGQILCYYGWFLFRTGSYQEADRTLQNGIALLRACRDEQALSLPIFCQAFCNFLLGNYVQAKEQLHESETLGTIYKDQAVELYAKSVRIFLQLSTGDQPDTHTIQEISQLIADKLGAARIVSNSHYLLGLCALARGEFDLAERHLQEGLIISRRAGDTWNMGLIQHYLGRVSLARKDWMIAKERQEAGSSLMELLGEKLGIVFCLLGLGWAEQGLKNHRASRDHFNEALEIAADIHVPPQILEALMGIASCLLMEGEVDRAADLLSIIVAHPATAFPVRQQAQAMLNACPAAPEHITGDDARTALNSRVIELLAR
jgi:predicted ATPase/DNA-binding SARP family transcriptional activator